MDIFIFLLEPQIGLIKDIENNIYIHDNNENFIYRLDESINLTNTELIKDIFFEHQYFYYLDDSGKILNITFHKSDMGNEFIKQIPKWSDSQKRKEILLNMHHIQTVIIESDLAHVSNECVEYEIVLNHFLLKKELILNYILYKNILYFLNNLYQKGSFLFSNFFPIIYVPFERIIKHKYARRNVALTNHFYFDLLHFSYREHESSKQSKILQPRGNQTLVNSLEFQQQNLHNGYIYFYPEFCTQELIREAKHGQRDSKKLLPAKGGQKRNLLETFDFYSEKVNSALLTTKDNYKIKGDTSKNGIYKQIKFYKTHVADRDDEQEISENNEIVIKKAAPEPKILYQFDEARKYKRLRDSKKKVAKKIPDAQKFNSKHTDDLEPTMVLPLRNFKKTDFNNFCSMSQTKSMASGNTSDRFFSWQSATDNQAVRGAGYIPSNSDSFFENKKQNIQVMNDLNKEIVYELDSDESNSSYAKSTLDPIKVDKFDICDEEIIFRNICLREDTEKVLSVGTKFSRIVLITVGWNESNMLEMFLAYYAPQVDKIVYYDNESTDSTIEFIRNFFENNGIHCEYEIYSFKTDNQIRDDLLLDLKNEAWKQFQESFDWAVIVDVDEFIIPPNRKNLREYIFEHCNSGAIQCVGYQMFGTRYELSEIKKGARCEKYDKVCIWNLKSTVNTNYSTGCHKCRPDFISKDIHIQTRTCELRHMKFVGNYKYLCDRAVLYHERLSKVNKKNNWGIEYSLSNFKKNYLYFSRKTIDLVF